MTPELKTACEVVFQEHKSSSQPVKWSKDAFRGQISIGLTELAKETLVKKNIIILPNKSKKIITQLNPAVAAASSFEEAELIIGNTKSPITLPVVNPLIVDETIAAPVTKKVPVNELIEENFNIVNFEEEPTALVAQSKWYLKPVFYYFIWPVCALVAGAGLTYLLNLAFTEIFWHR